MAKKPILNIVATGCQPKDESRFNKWYNEVHIPMLLKYKGIVGAARYKITSETNGQPKYIALYRLADQKAADGLGKSPELAAAIKEMQESWGAGIEIKYAANYELIKEWGKRGKAAPKKRPVINIVSTRCPPEDDDKFNRWYNEVHIPMIMKFKKLEAVARYKSLGKAGESPAYIAVYKFASLKDFQELGSSPEMAAAGKEMRESWGQKIEIMSRVQYELIQEWEN